MHNTTVLISKLYTVFSDQKFLLFCLLVLLYIMLAVFHATAIMIWWNKDVYNKTPQGHADTRPLKMTV